MRKGVYKATLTGSGSHMIGANTLSSITIAMMVYKLKVHAYTLYYAGSRLTRELCNEVMGKLYGIDLAVSERCGSGAPCDD